jgi:hypothetical protein
MINFQPLRDKEVGIEQFLSALTLTRDDLRTLTNEMVDRMLALLADCVDADVIFAPDDPAKHDQYATNPAETDLAWNLGHVIVHATASSEESAALAAEMARGVTLHGRSRYETPWQQVNTVAQCTQRLQESRRMRLASLEMWPDEAHVTEIVEAWPNGPKINTFGRFLFGLMHDDSHLAQIAEIVKQARTARGV